MDYGIIPTTLLLSCKTPEEETELKQALELGEELPPNVINNIEKFIEDLSCRRTDIFIRK